MILHLTYYMIHDIPHDITPLGGYYCVSRLCCSQLIVLLAITCNVSWSSCFRGSLRDPNEVSRVEGVVLGEKGHLLDQKFTNS